MKFKCEKGEGTDSAVSCMGQNNLKSHAPTPPHNPRHRYPYHDIASTIRSPSNNIYPGHENTPIEIAIRPYFDIMASDFQYSVYLLNDVPPTLLPVLTVKANGHRRIDDGMGVKSWREGGNGGRISTPRLINALINSYVVGMAGFVLFPCRWSRVGGGVL